MGTTAPATEQHPGGGEPSTPPEPTVPRLHRAATEIGKLEALDAPAAGVLGVLGKVLRPGKVRDAMSGRYLGHALHPLMTDVPIGTWTSATILDVAGGEDARQAARRLIGVGILAALPTAATGWVEWGDSAKTRAATRRVGLVHAAANVAALTLYGASWLQRRRGGDGRALAYAGAAALGVGGHLGGHLAYVHGEGVAVTTFEDGPHEWTTTIPEAELEEGRLVATTALGVPLLLVRHEGRIHALADRCTHRGGPLSDGQLVDGCVECPWHGSRFRLADGAPVHGPAGSPQPAYETRIEAGRVEVRQATDPTP